MYIEMLISCLGRRGRRGGHRGPVRAVPAGRTRLQCGI